MISITLGDKKYTVPTITGRVMREISEMDELYGRARNNEAIGPEEMDTAVEWLCLVFKHQFAPDEVYDNYPADRFWTDIFTIYLAVKNSVTNKLADFPTLPEATEA